LSPYLVIIFVLYAARIVLCIAWDAVTKLQDLNDIAVMMSPYLVINFVQ
jgi:hypothetical protein